MLVEDLRIGQQQLVEIAKAVSLDAQILIMDEPTSALSAAEVEVLFKVIADLKRQGVAIVYISHRLEELIRIGDYITVLRDGHITGQEEMKNVDTQWIVRQMIGSDAKDFAKADDHKPGGEVFRAEEICLPRATGGLAVDHVSLSLRAGEILGIYGLMGAGRSELFDCIMGRHGQATGRIFIDGKEVRERDTTRRIRRGLALIPEDRQREGLVPILSVASNLTLASLRKFASLFHIRGVEERKAVDSMVKELSIKVAESRQRGDFAFRRQPAEGGDRQGAADQPEGAADGRAQPRHRRRRQGRRIPHHAQAVARRARHSLRHIGPRRGDGAFRPHRGHEQRQADRHVRARGSDRGDGGRGVRQGTRAGNIREQRTWLTRLRFRRRPAEDPCS